MTFTSTIRKILYTGMSIASLALINSAQAQDTPSLTYKVYNAAASSFHVNAVLLSGKKDAILIDTGFSRADALRIVADVLDSGKQLNYILISNADPDYYFGASQIKQFFPNAKLVSSAAVQSRIAAKMQAKLGFWGPKMAANAPLQLLLPEVLTDNKLELEGQAVELRGTEGILAHRPYVWVPALQAIMGNVAIFNGLHVWTADTQSAAEKNAWIAQLQEIRNLKPQVVIPGHMQAGAKTDISALDYTASYLTAFMQASQQAQNAAQLQQIMHSRYPGAGMGLALDIGAKVAKGEMKW